MNEVNTVNNYHKQHSNNKITISANHDL